MDLSALALALVLGVLSTVHCWGMCGGLLLAFSAPATADRLPGVRRLASYNFGRITSYTLAGGIAGGLAGAALSGLAPGAGHRGLQLLAAVVLIVSGLALMKRLPGHAWLQGLGLAGWRQLQPVTRTLLPATHFHQRFLLGMVWGWLPCGFVYSMLALAGAQGTAPAGAAVMLALGLGTLPGMLAAQAGIAALRQRLRHLHAPTLAAWLLLSSGLALLLVQTPWRAAHHHKHGLEHAPPPPTLQRTEEPLPAAPR